MMLVCGATLGRMTDSQIDQLVAAVRALPSVERLRVARRVLSSLSADERTRVAQEVAALPEEVGEGALAMLGLFADEPEIVDEVCRQAYAERVTAHPRQLDDE